MDFYYICKVRFSILGPDLLAKERRRAKAPLIKGIDDLIKSKDSTACDTIRLAFYIFYIFSVSFRGRINGFASRYTYTFRSSNAILFAQCSSKRQLRSRNRFNALIRDVKRFRGIPLASRFLLR